MLLYFGLALCQLVIVDSSNKLSKGITDIALQLSSSIEANSDKNGDNFVWSPYSVHSAFSQVLLGAEADTLSELELVLGVGKKDTEGYNSLRSSIRSGSSTLKVANLLALAKGFKPKTSYTNQLQTKFGSELRELDFAANPLSSVNELNSFVSNSTNGNIDKLLSVDQITPDTAMVLINAVYFKALWKTAFDAKNTFDSEFNTPSGVIQTPFMPLNIKTNLIENENFKMLELPYQDSSKSLLIILPQREQDSIMDLIRTTNFSSIRSGEPKNVNVLLPKFKVKAKTQLKELMMEAGVRRLFNDQANLTGISEKPLKVTDAVQEAFIEVNEEGTEAAAATGIILGLRIGIRREQFSVNRPFGFVLYDFNQNIPVFMGKINNPNIGNDIVSRSAASTEKTSNAEEPAKEEKNVCLSLQDSIPNALNNVQLCKQAEDGKMFDWLRQYRSVCEESKKVHFGFKKNKCELAWCQYASQNLQEWRRAERTCKRRSRQLDTCRSNENRLKAFTSLDCQNN